MVLYWSVVYPLQLMIQFDISPASVMHFILFIMTSGITEHIWRMIMIWLGPSALV